MSDIFSDAFNNLQSILLTACPEVAANGVWEMEQADAEAYKNRTFPFIVISFGEPSSADWGSVRDSWEIMAYVYYAMERKGPMGPFRAALMRMKHAIDNAPESQLCVIEFPGVAWDKTLPMDEVLQNTNATGWAARLQVKLLVSELVGATD